MIRQTGFWLVMIFLLVTVMSLGCDDSDSNDGPKDGGPDGDSDSDTDTDSDSDGDTDSDSDTDTEKDTAPTEPPDAPAISSPTNGQKVASPVRVEGTGEVDATVFVVVWNGDKEIGGQVGSVGGNGTFALSADYDAPDDGTALTVEVMLKNDIGASGTTEVSVVHQPQTISGSISQESGGEMGTAVHVRLYNSATEAVDSLQEITLPATEEEKFPSTDYSFDVGEGTYYVRAFRDSHGAHWGDPDGEPTYPGDAQAPASSEIVITDANAADIDLVLTGAEVKGYFQDFNVYTHNESGEARAPEFEDPPNSGEWKRGKGLCEGYHMQIFAWGQDDISSLSAPKVRLPDGTIVTLIDDGGCGDAADNTSMSYDHDANDQYFSYGWPDPTDADAGKYFLFFRDELLDFIHVERDQVDTITKLSRNAQLLSPTGAGPAPLSSTLTWNAVDGAKAYDVRFGSNISEYRYDFITVTEASFQPDKPLPDTESFQFEVRVYDADISDGQDYDAQANSVSSSFVTDSTGENSITISGNIVNNTDVSAPVHVEAIFDGDHWQTESTITVPKDETTYSLVMLRKDASDEVRLRAFLDADRSGDDDSSRNRLYGFDSDQLDASGNISLDLVFTPPLELKSPSDGATGVGDTPTFQWKDYSANAPEGPWSYALFAFNKDAGQGNNFPDIVWGMSNTTTSIDFSNAAEMANLYDVIYLFSCTQTEGTYANGTCTGGAPTANAGDLSAGGQWDWGIVVLLCDFADYAGNVDEDKNEVDDYTDCVIPALGQDGNFYVMSDSWDLFTD